MLNEQKRTLVMLSSRTATACPEFQTPPHSTSILSIYIPCLFACLCFLLLFLKNRPVIGGSSPAPPRIFHPGLSADFGRKAVLWFHLILDSFTFPSFSFSVVLRPYFFNILISFTKKHLLSACYVRRPC